MCRQGSITQYVIEARPNAMITVCAHSTMASGGLSRHLATAQERRDPEAEQKEAEAIAKEAKEEKTKDRQRTEEEEREKARKEVDQQEHAADGPTE